MKQYIIGFLVICIIGVVVFTKSGVYTASPTPSLFWGIAQEGNQFTEKKLKKQQQSIELPISFLEFFQMWPKNPSESPPQELLSSFEEINSFGAVCVLTWEPMYHKNDKPVSIPYQKILMGNYDSYLEKMAQIIKEFEHPILIRFAHEMNLSHYHWGTSKNEYGPESPQIYIKMFQYVVDYFKKNNVDNALWVFCPNHYSIPNPIDDPAAKWNHATHYYPGDKYVDVLGMDGYNWGKISSANNQSFKQIFSLLHNELTNIAPKKPIMVFETGTGHSHKQWLEEAIIQSKKWNLTGLIWFQIDKENKWALKKADTTELDSFFSKRPLSQIWTKELLP